MHNVGLKSGFVDVLCIARSAGSTILTFKELINSVPYVQRAGVRVAVQRYHSDLNEDNLINDLSRLVATGQLPHPEMYHDPNLLNRTPEQVIMKSSRIGM